MRSLLFSLIFCVLAAPALPLRASVVLTGTRVIYPETLPGKTLQLSNDDARPWLVQMWLDETEEGTEAQGTQMDVDRLSVPFMLSPPIFRVEPHSGHLARLRLLDAARLPTDRESLFYLNFSQIPALTAEQQEANRLLLIHTSKVKLFYRPRALAAPDMRKLACALRFELNGGELAIENPAPFHAVVSRAWLALGGQDVTLIQGEALAPFSTRHRTLPQAFSAPDRSRVQITLVNDYGADEHYQCSFSPLH